MELEIGSEKKPIIGEMITKQYGDKLDQSTTFLRFYSCFRGHNYGPIEAYFSKRLEFRTDHTFCVKCVLKNHIRGRKYKANATGETPEEPFFARPYDIISKTKSPKAFVCNMQRKGK